MRELTDKESAAIIGTSVWWLLHYRAEHQLREGGCSCHLCEQTADLQNVYDRKLQDCVEYDGTDAAHPAWWRGMDFGIDKAVDRIRAVLEGRDNGKGIFGSIALEMLRRDLLKLLPQINTQVEGTDTGNHTEDVT